jgi:hypothetical protein
LRDGLATTESLPKVSALPRAAWFRSSFLLAVVALGAYLRLWHLGAQIPFDDEWHAIAYVIEHDVGYLLGHASRLGANSVPHNLYLRLAYRTVGLSEWSIAFPSLATGLLLLWCYPRWVWQRLGAAAGMVSGVLLACAPFLIFYSRFARPYAPLLLLEFLALGHLADWLRSARRYHALSAAGFGALAIWVQVSAAPPLLAAWLAAGLWQWRSRRRDPSTGPGPRQLLLAGALMTALAGVLVLPALLVSTNPAPDAAYPFTTRTADVVSQLLLGSAWLEPRLLLGGACVAGLLVAARRAGRELALLAVAAGTSVAVVALVHPFMAEVGAVFARYCLPLFLLVPFAVGAAGQWLAEHVASATLRRAGGALGLPALLGALYYSGPLPFVYFGNASFTKHPVFQYQYGEGSAEQSLPDPVSDTLHPLARAQLHPFYALLAREGTGEPIIEYPFLIGGETNRLYFAQMVHQRPVLAGYYQSGMAWFDRMGLALDSPPSAAGLTGARGFLMRDMAIDHALAHVPDRSAIRFRTVVDLADLDAVRASSARYVVLHWNLPRELLLLEVASHLGAARGRFVARLAERLAAAFGPPLLHDEALTVYRVR